MRNRNTPDITELSYEPGRFGERVRAARESAGLRKAELAERAGITERTVRNVERGRGSYEDTRLAIARALKLPYSELIGSAAAGSARGNARSWSRFLIPGLIAALIMIVTLVYLQRQGTMNATIHHDEALLEVRHGLTHRILWSREYPSRIAQARPLPWRSDGPLMALSVYDYPGNPGLQILDLASGAELWSFKPSREEYLETFPPSLLENGGWHCTRIALGDLDGDGVQEIVAAFRHCFWLPSSIEILDQRGERIGSYHHWGHINDLKCIDIDHDGKAEVLASATNNAHDGASILMLDDRCCRGSSQDAAIPVESARPDSARMRVVFPAYDPELMSLLARVQLDGNDLYFHELPEGPLRIRFSVGPIGRRVHIVLDEELRPVDIDVSDTFRAFLETAVAQERLPERYLRQPFWDDWLARHERFEAGHWPVESSQASSSTY